MYYNHIGHLQSIHKGRTLQEQQPHTNKPMPLKEPPPHSCINVDPVFLIIHQDSAQQMKKKFRGCGKISHFKAVCKNAETRPKAMHEV